MLAYKVWKMDRASPSIILNLIITYDESNYIWTETSLILANICIVVYIINQSRQSPFDHGLISILAWINDNIRYKVWDEITYPFPGFPGGAYESCVIRIIPYISLTIFKTHYIFDTLNCKCILVISNVETYNRNKYKEHNIRLHVFHCLRRLSVENW